MLLTFVLVVLFSPCLADPVVSIAFQGPSDVSRVLQARPTTVFRPRSPHAFHNARQRSRNLEECEGDLQWAEHRILGPDIEDRHTLAQLARMSAAAYSAPGRNKGYELDPAWNTSFPIGWEDSDNGFRGRVFMSSDNSTVVLSIKGTTLPFGGPTSKEDRYNDNLLFSCCCARVDASWVFRKVCDCYRHSWRCDDTCLSKALIEDSLFYSVGVNLIDDLFFLYPTANVWLVGHSLGGSLAALLGTTYGLPVVAFESPGDKLAAQRLHLPLPPPGGPLGHFLPAVTHVYHNADPIPLGACTGPRSLCAQAGYALETRCHLGKSIVFDTVDKFGWKVELRKHPIRSVITEVLETEGIEWEEGRSVPLAREELDCVDCFKWEFGDFDELHEEGALSNNLD